MERNQKKIKKELCMVKSVRALSIVFERVPCVIFETILAVAWMTSECSCTSDLNLDSTGYSLS